MNRGRISAQIVLCFLAMLLLVVIGCSGGSDSPPQTYNISGAVTGATLAGVTINLTGAATVSTTTDAEGKFSFTGRANGTYTVTPVKAGYTFNPISSAVMVSGANVTNTNFVATIYDGPTYNISGSVSGAATSGVTITLGGDKTGSVVTGAGGTYTISSLVPGSYTVTPSLTGFIFNPISTAVTITTANSTGNNFVATALQVPHSISGTVTVLGLPLSGVTITVTGTATATATTNASGVFNVTGLYDGGYTVTPSKSGYTFSPVSLAATVSGADLAGKDFTANPIPVDTYTISGTVSGAVLSGVTISLSGSGTGSTITNTSGNYSFPGIANGNYTVTPSLTGYTFSPISSAANVSGANITGKNFVATAIPTTFTQADLTGTWRMNLLKTGYRGDGIPVNEWDRARITINSSGVATCLSVDGSFDGGNVCPNPFDLTLTMNTSTGVITQSGNHAVRDGGHMTMTSNKNFLAGTGTGGTGAIGQSSYQLMIVQKEVTGTVYTNADIQSKSFVYHMLSVGSQSKWQYGVGTINAAGLINITSETNPAGTTVPGEQGTMSVDANGVVTMNPGMDTYRGFLSDDKKTIVGTFTESDGGNLRYRLMIIQITGQTYTAGFLPPGASVHHVLGSGATAFWIHYTSTVGNAGVITFSDWVASNGGTAPALRTGSLDATGKVTMTEDSSYHGQVSHDRNFTVSTWTGGTSPNFVYMLGISTN